MVCLSGESGAIRREPPDPIYALSSKVMRILSWESKAFLAQISSGSRLVDPTVEHC